MKIVQILKNHKWAVMLAVLVGLIMALPQIYFRYDQQDIYQGVDFTFGSSEFFYWGRIQEVRDGYPSLGNIYSAEEKGKPYLQPPLGEILTASLGRIFSLGIKDTILFSRFLFPVLLFLFIYGFLYLLIQKKYLALIASAGVLLADNFFNLFSRTFFQDLLKGEMPNIFGLAHTQLIHPQISSLFFFSFLLFFWLFLIKKTWVFGVLSGIILGFSFYVYLYTWTFILAFLAILGLIFLLKKEWADLKRIIFSVLLALFIAIPYFLNFLQGSQYPEFLKAWQRMGLIETRQPTLSFLPLAILIIFLLFFPRLWKKRYIFCLALLLAPFLVLNQQIITGRVLMNAYYHWQYHKPLAIIFLSICFFELVEKRMSSRFLKKTMIFGIMALIIFNGLLADKAIYNDNVFRPYYQDSYHSMIELQNYGLVLDWLNNNTKKDEVVLANDMLSRLIPAYSSCNVGPNYHYASKYLVSENELLEGIFLIYRLQQVTGEQAAELFFEERGDISHQVYSEYYRQKLGDYDRIPDEVISSIIQKYQAFLTVPLKEALQKYQIKYLVWDTKKEPVWSLGQYPFLIKIYESQSVKIYQVI